MRNKFSTLVLGWCAMATGPALCGGEPLPWAEWVEPDFPFFSSTLDARKAGPGFPENNLTPRGLILNLGADCWVCFDTDLVRVAAVWRGKGVSPRAMAPASYNHPERKPPAGQFPAPEPEGVVWLANGIYPGWQTGTQPAFADPREPAPSPEEVGRGPLAEETARFRRIRMTTDGAVLEYTVGKTEVREWIRQSKVGGQTVIERHFELTPSQQARVLVLGIKSPETAISLSPGAAAVLDSVAVAPPNASPAPKVDGQNRVAQNPSAAWIVRVAPGAGPVSFCVAIAAGRAAPAISPRPISAAAAPPRWPQTVRTEIALSTAKDAYVVDDIALPASNPWRRAVRISDIEFLKDGTGVGVTVDGDVWLIRGLHEGAPRWKRFTSGLHEPMSLAIRDEQIFVFDRQGIWRLRDTNGDDEADVHELFSNAFAQTADMRELPAALCLGPGGEFFVAKGGQEMTTLGKHNGSVLRISADGRQATIVGYGFRQPNLGVNVRTGLVIASDQQGQYVPSTPLHVVRDGRFYGFLSSKRPREAYPAPIADPLTWIPYDVDASAVSLAWLFGARMGTLNDNLVHIAFNQPELFRVLLNNRGTKPQAAVVSVTDAFDTPLLHGSVNPRDGQFYIAGFQILGWEATRTTRIAGLVRVRYTGLPSTLPVEVVPMDKGVLLRFDVALDAAKATEAASYTVASWNYHRSYKYGSPQLKADGTPGIDWHGVSSAYLSEDRRAVFVGVPNMKPAMQMRIGWALTTAEGSRFEKNAYFTPYELPRFDPGREGFGNLTVDLSPRAVAARSTRVVSEEEGRRLYQLFGCFACHSIDDSANTTFKTAPRWKGLYGVSRVFGKTGPTVIADDAYLRESILDPAAKIVPGFESAETGMPSYAGVLSDAQVESLILFIKSLK